MQLFWSSRSEAIAWTESQPGKWEVYFKGEHYYVRQLIKQTREQEQQLKQLEDHAAKLGVVFSAAYITSSGKLQLNIKNIASSDALEQLRKHIGARRYYVMPGDATCFLVAYNVD